MAILVQAIVPEMNCAWILQASAQILCHEVIHKDFFPSVLLSCGEEETIAGLPREQAEDMGLWMGRGRLLPGYVSPAGVFCFEEIQGLIVLTVADVA